MSEEPSGEKDEFGEFATGSLRELYKRRQRGAISGKQFLSEINKLFDKGLIDIWIRNSRRHDDITIITLSKEEKTVNQLQGFKSLVDIAKGRFLTHEREKMSLRASELRDDIFDFYGNKCVRCGMTQEEHWDRFNDDDLQLHHMTPVSLRANIHSRKITDQFIPLCRDHHLGGLQ